MSPRPAMKPGRGQRPSPRPHELRNNSYSFERAPLSRARFVVHLLLFTACGLWLVIWQPVTRTSSPMFSRVVGIVMLAGLAAMVVARGVKALHSRLDR
jgi:hypothetical protein